MLNTPRTKVIPRNQTDNFMNEFFMVTVNMTPRFAINFNLKQIVTKLRYRN